jgi:hypothetical protein
MAGRAVIVALSAVLLISPIDAGAITIFDDAGSNTVAIQDTVDAFRAALGNPNNMNNPGPLATGRREINWDGGGPPVIDGTAPATPFVTFQNTRGGTFTTPGTGLTQAAATGGLLSLDLINPTTPLVPLSPNRRLLWAAISRTSLLHPGHGATAAGVRGFMVSRTWTRRDDHRILRHRRQFARGLRRA